MTGRETDPPRRVAARDGARRTVAEKSAARKPTAQKATARKPTAQKPTAQKPVAKKATAKKASPARHPSGRPAARGVARAAGTRPSLARAGSSRPGSSARGRTVAPEQRQSSGWVRGAILASIVVMLAVTLIPTARSLIRQRGDISALQDKVVAQTQNVDDLTKEQQRWTDPAYVEQQARERLKFVKVGDRSYSVIDGTKQPSKVPSGAVVAAPSADSNSPWYGQVWQSVQLADQPSAGMAPVPDK